jgi:hypothetical protein
VLALMAFGVATFLAGLSVDPHHTWFSFLVCHSFFMGLGIGACFILVIHYLASAGWIIVARRVFEAMASYIPIAFAFNILLFFGLKKIYPWTDTLYMQSDKILAAKIGFFSFPFYAARVLFFFVITTWLSQKLIGNSTAQDKEGGVERTNKQKPLSALFLVLFAPSFTMFSVDLVKSLDPKWFSTMFGVYMFIGFVQASVAASILTIRSLQKHGYLQEVTADHFHDLGKYLFGFSIFWAYIGVSQYLLIWYANLPEETTFYLARQVPGWVYLAISLPLLRFFLPFLMLLPRAAKRSSSYLALVSCIVLFGEWIDLNYLIMPTFSPDGFRVGWQDFGLFIGFFGFFLFFVRRFLAKQATMPVKDPYLHESLHHHVM